MELFGRSPGRPCRSIGRTGSQGIEARCQFKPIGRRIKLATVMHVIPDLLRDPVAIGVRRRAGLYTAFVGAALPMAGTHNPPKGVGVCAAGQTHSTGRGRAGLNVTAGGNAG